MGGPVPGSDGPADTATHGFTLNHVCLHIRSKPETITFYRDILGMRTIFTVDCGSFEILYFQYPPDPAAPETGEEMSRLRHHREGLLEFMYIKQEIPDKSATTNIPSNGFSHLGFTVPDLPRAVARMKEHGVTILKDIGEEVTKENWGLSEEPTDEKFASITKGMAMVVDPNGFSVELMQK